MKKLLSILAVLAIVCTCCVLGVGTALAAPAESSADDFLVFDGVLEEYVGDGGDVVIPASLGIKEIAAQSFFENEDITSLVIPEGVKKIGSKAFFYCKNLASVTFPYSLEELDQHEFAGCGITEITIPGNCETVSYGCFSSCTFLEKLTLSYGVKDIMPMAFQGTSIEKVVFPETVSLICGRGAFGNNKNEAASVIEYYICNPDCVIGKCATTIPLALKKQWDSPEESPWSHSKAAATFNIYVIEGSEADKFLTENGQTLVVKVNAGKNDIVEIMRKEAQFFKDLPENKAGYGTPKPSTSTGTNPSNPGTNPSNPGTDPSNPGTDPSNPGTDPSNPGNNSNVQNGTNGSVQNVTEEGNTTTLIIIICVIGGIMLLAVIAVIILAATGVLFGNKAAPDAEASAEDEATEAQDEAAENASSEIEE